MGAPRAADINTAVANERIIASEMGRRTSSGEAPASMRRTTDALREELRAKGIKGFKRGGRVHRTGIYKLHRGERVIPARSRRGRRR